MTSLRAPTVQLDPELPYQLPFGPAQALVSTAERKYIAVAEQRYIG
jgi:hypothetical protein